MKNKPVVFLDSGVGGLPYLREAQLKMPFLDFIYLADNAHFPYGGRDVEALISIVHDLIKKIITAFDPAAVVIACNTASVVTLSFLREKYGIPFVGVVPAVKPAAAYTKNGTIGLLATETTVKNIYTDNLIEKFAHNCTVKKFAGVNIVDFVENNLYETDEKELDTILHTAVDYFLHENIDTLIIGCTHFLFIREELHELFGPGVEIIDSVTGVINQLQRLIYNTYGKGKSYKMNRGEAFDEDKQGYGKFYITGKTFTASRYKLFANNFDLEWGGAL